MSKPVTHINAKQGEIAKTVLMPGDPLRAKYIAENYLENQTQFNKIRNMLGFTGVYKRKRVSVMGSGMGMPSMAIYAYELFKFYNVECIIRIGTCGAYSPDLDVYDVVIFDEAWTQSTIAKTQNKYEKPTVRPSEELTNKLENSAKSLNYPYVKATVHTTDVFYRQDLTEYKIIREKHNCQVAEMEAFALFYTAKLLNKKAAALATVAVSWPKGIHTTTEEREKSFTQMMEIALNASI